MTAPELERIARQQGTKLLAVAARRSRSPADAEDAVQEALATAFAMRERIRTDTAISYITVTARHAALHQRQRTDRTRSLDEPAAGQVSRHELIADPRQADVDGRLDTIAGLRALKRDEARALLARMLGFSYREIADTFGWSYTKTNRCVTEGRAALRAWLVADVPGAASAAGDQAGEPARRPDRGVA